MDLEQEDEVGSPRHDPSQGENRGPDNGHAGGGRRSSMLGNVLVVVIAIAVVTLLIVLHLTGLLGPGAH
jgi:hypothetical protein